MLPSKKNSPIFDSLNILKNRTMAENKDYSQLTLEELQTEEKKMKKKEIYAALAIGFLIGIMVFGVVKKGFGFLYIYIPIVFILAILRNSKTQKQKLNQIKSAINNYQIR
jgi:hypothetical protein